MELGNLMLMCGNLVCVSTAGLLVFWVLMHIQTRDRRTLRLYDEPPPTDKKPKRE